VATTRTNFLPAIKATMLLPEKRSDVTLYILLEDFKFNGHIVPKNFVTDGITIPKIFWSILPPAHRYFPAAVVHDYLLTTTTRRIADIEFKEALKLLEISKLRRWIIYSVLRSYSFFKEL
jgi:hypothetical protein